MANTPLPAQLWKTSQSLGQLADKQVDQLRKTLCKDAAAWRSRIYLGALALILSRLDKERRGILLLHDTKQQTAAMLPGLLQELKKRGYKIVALAPGTEPAPTRAAPEGWTSATEKIIADVFAKARRAAKPRGPAREGAEESGQGATLRPNNKYK